MIIRLLLIILCFFISSIAMASENLYYLTNLKGGLVGGDTLTVIAENQKEISILAPQVFKLASNGTLSGHLDPALLMTAKQYHLKLMPLIINKDFDQDIIHVLLHYPAAAQYAIHQMIKLCDSYHLYGLQLDIENIHVQDKALFTEFYHAAANALHQKGYKISVAVIPRNDKYPNSSAYAKWYYDNWSGAYDYSKLASYGDFISLMTYDRHTSLTTPGPIAPLAWVKSVLNNLLQTIPAAKISLGIPAYSGYWTTGMIAISEGPHRLSRFSFRGKESQISYENAMQRLQEAHGKLNWDVNSHSAYGILDHDGLYDYLFLENAKSFQEKFQLVKQYHLRGISVWKLGMEDPAIWKIAKI